MTNTDICIKKGIVNEEFIINKQTFINKRTVPTLPLFETIIFAPVTKTYNEPNSTNISLIKIEIKITRGT